MDGKYCVVKDKSKYLVRDITTGYVEVVCYTAAKATQICNQLNRT